MAAMRPWARWREESVKVVPILLGLLSALQPAWAQHVPGVGDRDRRIPVSTETPPFDALVRVQTELGERCSGFLIAPALVMTAAHCLFQARVPGYVQAGSVHVLAAYRLGVYRAHSAVVAIRIPDAYRPLDEPDSAGADRAILVLRTPVGTSRQTLPLERPPTLPAPIRLAGYGRDRDELAVESAGCRILGYATDGRGRVLLTHDCQATSGTSGAPLVWRRPDGRWVAVGVQIEALTRGDGGLAVPTLDPILSDRSADR